MYTKAPFSVEKGTFTYHKNINFYFFSYLAHQTNQKKTYYEAFRPTHIHFINHIFMC